jgi:hypothetical protein
VKPGDAEGVSEDFMNQRGQPADQQRKGSRGRLSLGTRRLDLANPAKPERAMATMNISLPDDLRDFVEQQVREKSYSSSSEYLRELIRRPGAAAGRSGTGGPGD